MFFTWNPSVVARRPTRPDTSETLRTTNQNNATHDALQDIDADDLLQVEQVLFIPDDVDIDFGEDELWTIGAESPLDLLDRLQNRRGMYPAIS